MSRTGFALPVQVGGADTAGAGTVGSGARDDGRRARRNVDPWVLAAAFFVLYAALSLTRYRQMRTLSWDLGIFEQAIKSYAHLHAPVADLKGPGFNILGDHFSPITALIAPFYRLFPTPVTLLVAQALLFALSAVPVTRAAGRGLGRVGGLAIGTAYGLSWGIQNAVDFDFHEVAFAMPLLAFSLEAVLRKRWTAAMWWAVPLLLVKEDMGASVTMIGLVVWLRAGKQDRQDPVAKGGRTRTHAARLMGVGVTVSLWQINGLIPAFHGSGYNALYHINGDGSLAGHIPLHTAIHTLLWILLPTTALLALRSPLMLVALPTVGWRFLSRYPEHWGTDWHYNAVLMPVVFLALVDAVGRLTAGNSRVGRFRRLLRGYAHAMPLALAGAAVALSAQLPLSGLAHRSAYTVDGRTRAAEKLLNRIPDGATVEANVGPISRLARRTDVYWIGSTNGVTPRYLALENRSGWLTDPAGYARQLHPRARYTVLGRAGGYVVLARG